MVDRAMRWLAQIKFMKDVSAANERRILSLKPTQIEGKAKAKRQEKAGKRLKS